MKNATHNNHPTSIRVIDLVTDDPNHKFAPYQDMANAILSIVCANSACSLGDLLAVGYSNHEIAERWHMANEMARIELKIIGKANSKQPPSIKSLAFRIVCGAKRLAPFVSKYLVLT
ncbi:MAG: hypothetical protein KGI37_10475 [Alphaproteobacteria bacterium]|nr:hypothetical protein [Alphaproteobacteria bacterium]